MFGTLTNRPPGGLARLRQVISDLTLTLKGPPDGDLTIAGGDAVSAPSNVTLAISGVASLTGGAGAASNGAGAQVSVTGGAGQGTGVGGAANLLGGAGGSSAAGGAVTVRAGQSANGVNGATTFIRGGNSGSGVNLSGGNLELLGGFGGNGGRGGHVHICPQQGSTLGRYGDIQLDSGSNAAIVTNSTDGFVTMSATETTPSGSPAYLLSRHAVILPDVTNKRWWMYDRTSWRRANMGGVINSQSANYTLTAEDGGPERAVLHPSTDANNRTFTIPANASVAYDVGTILTFINDSANNLSIAINTDTLVLTGSGATGTRTLAQYGIATAMKISSTRWYIDGTNLT